MMPSSPPYGHTPSPGRPRLPGGGLLQPLTPAAHSTHSPSERKTPVSSAGPLGNRYRANSYTARTAPTSRPSKNAWGNSLRSGRQRSRSQARRKKAEPTPPPPPMKPAMAERVNKILSLAHRYVQRKFTAHVKRRMGALSEAIRADPYQPDNYLDLATVLIEFGDKKVGISVLKETYELFPRAHKVRKALEGFFHPDDLGPKRPPSPQISIQRNKAYDYVWRNRPVLIKDRRRKRTVTEEAPRGAVTVRDPRLAKRTVAASGIDKIVCVIPGKNGFKRRRARRKTEELPEEDEMVSARGSAYFDGFVQKSVLDQAVLLRKASIAENSYEDLAVSKAAHKVYTAANVQKPDGKRGEMLPKEELIV